MTLKITRREGESFMIDDDIKVTVLGRKYGGVEIAIDAPKDRRILRQELYEKMLAEGENIGNR